MALNFAGATTLTAVGSPVASISAAGVLSVPNRPIASVEVSGLSAAVGTDIVFNSPLFNVGNCLNLTNGRFTAPVAGVYHVCWRQLAPNAGVSGHYVFGLFVNGGQYIPTYTLKEAAGVWNSCNLRTHVYMNPNDYCTIRYIAGDGGMYNGGGYSQFSIHLVL